ncbi:MAG TPA: hypothetical protein VF802_03760 [Candidatus Limnocylindrales bacterium]
MEAMTVVALAGWFLVGVAVILSRLPVGTCPQCDHCRAERSREEWERSREREIDLKRLYGVARCARCGQFHRIDGPC